MGRSFLCTGAHCKEFAALCWWLLYWLRDVHSCKRLFYQRQYQSSLEICIRKTMALLQDLGSFVIQPFYSRFRFPIGVYTQVRRKRKKPSGSIITGRDHTIASCFSL